MNYSKLQKRMKKYHTPQFIKTAIFQKPSTVGDILEKHMIIAFKIKIINYTNYNNKKIMKTKTQKTNKIIITAKGWFDKINGNSYFAAKIELENGTFFIPFSYGYGEAYLYEAIKFLIKENYIPATVQNAWMLENYCNDNKIVLYYEIQRRCLKRELKQLVSK